MECMKLLHVLLFLLVISVPAFAQSGGAHVKGRVTDETGPSPKKVGKVARRAKESGKSGSAGDNQLRRAPLV